MTAPQLKASVRLAAAAKIEADANEFVKLADQLTHCIGTKPERKPGCYVWCTDIAGRDFDVVVKDQGKDMHVTVEKDGKPKYEADVDSAVEGIRAVEEGIGQYVRHEAVDAKAAKLFLKRFNQPMVIRR